jgi:hypothetical protein
MCPDHKGSVLKKLRLLKLVYREPQVIARALYKTFPAPEPKLNILNAGCGRDYAVARAELKT